MTAIAEMFSYGFMQRALIGGTLVALCLALLGVSLVLKRYAMIGDGLSHVGFGAVALALVTGPAPLLVATPIVMLAAFLLLRISSNSAINGDSAIALISSSALALGLIVTSLSSGMNADINGYLFGSILAMGSSDVLFVILLSTVVLLLYLFCYHPIFSVTFDEAFGRATGVRVGFYNTLLAMLTDVTGVIGMRMMGALLISSLIIFPPLTSMRLCSSFRGVVVCSALVSVICFAVGLVLSYFFSFPAGASVVMVNLCVFAVFACIGALTGKNK